MSLFKCCKSSNVRDKKISEVASQKVRQAEEEEEQKLVAEVAEEVDALSVTERKEQERAKITEGQLADEWDKQKAAADNMRQRIAELQKQIADRKLEKRDLLVSMTAEKESARLARAAEEEEVVAKRKEVSLNLEAAQKASQEKITVEMELVKSKLQQIYDDSKVKVEELSKKLLMEHQTLLNVTAEVEKERENLDSVLHQRTLKLQEKDATLSAQREEIDRLQKANIELSRLLERYKYSQSEKSGGKIAKRRRRDKTEIRVARTRCPRLGVLGTNVDHWLDRTSHNLSICCNSFGGNQTTPYVSNTPDGELCDVCCCSAGAGHDRQHCRLCRSLDLSDATLMP